MSNGPGENGFVQSYYGKVVRRTQDLRTSTCKCDDSTLSPYIRAIENKIDDEILTRVYGCGSPIPPAIEGCVVLDLGCGAGRDVYIASHLAGPDGFVIGVDMTREQIDVAEKHLHAQMKRFGHKRPNVAFRKGLIEDLEKIGIADNSVDVVISNCVINLSLSKNKVFSEIFRILKPGGELYFSDVFTGRRVPDHLMSDPVLHGECLSGAMYIEDFRRMLRALGCPDHRIMSKRRITIDNAEIEARVGMIDFYSVTVRAFKLDSLEDICEDYGHVAVYNGTIHECPHFFELDDHHRFITGKPVPVCGNTASMLQETRLARHFKVTGDRSVHYGPFECAPSSSKLDSEGKVGGACC
jgi:arsenite methyltransferase